jgi:osmotically-inducible protein OsmY
MILSYLVLLLLFASSAQPATAITDEEVKLPVKSPSAFNDAVPPDLIDVRSNRPDKNITDEEIAGKVERALLIDPWVDGRQLKIRVRHKKVYLTGDVESRFERNRATEVAARVHGVAAIENNIRLPVPDASKSDWEIQRAIANQLRWSLVAERNGIRVSVSRGVATLSGSVASLAEQEKAIDIALTAGARDVLNDLKVTGAPTR